MSQDTFEEVETSEETAEVEAVEEPAEKKDEKKTKRPSLPDGFGTPIQFAHALTDKLRKEGKYGEGDEFKPQVVYSYIKNRAKDNPIPVVYVNPEGDTVDDPAEGYRPAFRLNDDGEMGEALAWWDEKEERVAKRKANAAAKAAKKAEKGSKTEPAEEVVEVEDAGETVEAE